MRRVCERLRLAASERGTAVVASNKLPPVARQRLPHPLAYTNLYCWMPSSDAPIFAISSAVGIADSWLLLFSYPAAW